MNNVILVTGVLLLFAGCDGRSEYEKLVGRELAKDVDYDSLFFGYSLGMTRQGFYDRSWELNRQGLVMQGPQNQSVQYELKDELPYPAKMFYYADFHDGVVSQMRVRFLYNGWAPWNKELSADSLQRHVLDLMRSWYEGHEFIVYGVKKDFSGEHVEYVKVDGNRRISVEKLSDSEVLAVFTDLRAQRAIEQTNDD